jgi:hypothetical protein
VARAVTTSPPTESAGAIMFWVLSQIFKFMKTYRKFWLAPIILGIIALGGILVVAEGSAIAPFIYALF